MKIAQYDILILYSIIFLEQLTIANEGRKQEMVQIIGLDNEKYYMLTDVYGSRWIKEVKPHEFINMCDVVLNSSVIIKYNLGILTLDLGGEKTSLDSGDYARLEII